VRTRFVRDLKPNKLVSIAHDNPYMEEDGSRCFHFYTDEEGKKLAENIQKHLVSYLGTADLGVQEWSSYLMIEAYADRALIVPAVITDPAAEKRLKDTAHLRREAYAIFCGLVENLGLAADNTGAISGTVMDANGQPVEGALVTLDGAFSLQTGTDGGYRFVCVEPGSRSVSVFRDGYQTTGTVLKVSPQQETDGNMQLTELK
jgi:hypothetical protein